MKVVCQYEKRTQMKADEFLVNRNIRPFVCSAIQSKETLAYFMETYCGSYPCFQQTIGADGKSEQEHLQAGLQGQAKRCWKCK